MNASRGEVLAESGHQGQVVAQRHVTVPEALQLVQVVVEMRREQSRTVPLDGGLPLHHVAEHGGCLPGWNFKTWGIQRGSNLAA